MCSTTALVTSSLTIVNNSRSNVDVSEVAMNFEQKLQQNIPTISYEFFPPKNAQGWGTLYATLANAAQLNLDFVSVTYGAGGSTRKKTVSLVGRIQQELCIDTMAHLTCVGHSKDELGAILNNIQSEGVRAIMALRGDPPQGESSFTPQADGFSYGNELIQYIKSNYDFTIGCACYPEGHTESKDVDQDIHYLKLKQDCGADFAVTQLFFDNDYLYRFRDAAKKAGITIPIVAGIMPVTSVSQLDRFKAMCGCAIPQALRDRLNEVKDEDVVQCGIDYATEQCLGLLENNIAGIHIYTLNRSRSSWTIIENLRQAGYFKSNLSASPTK